jgi:hypothetical protein
LLQNTNFFYLYLVFKIPFDVNVMRLLPPPYADCVVKMETWNHYLKTGVVLNDIPLLFENKKSVLITKQIKQASLMGSTSNMRDADQVDVLDYLTNKKYKTCEFYSGGFPFPGMLSYEIAQCLGQTLPLLQKTKVVEFVPSLAIYVPQNETVAWVSPKEKTIEEVKLNPPDVLIFEASPYVTTKQEYLMAYVLCNKKLIIIRDTQRQELIKKWLCVSTPRAADASTVFSAPVTPAAFATLETCVPSALLAVGAQGMQGETQIPPLKKSIWTP